MTKLQLLNAYLTERLTVVVREILDVVGDTVAEYREETDRTKRENESAKRENESLRRQLRDILLLAETDWRSTTLSLSGQQQLCEQEWSSSQEQDPEPLQQSQVNRHGLQAQTQVALGQDGGLTGPNHGHTEAVRVEEKPSPGEAIPKSELNSDSEPKGFGNNSSLAPSPFSSNAHCATTTGAANAEVPVLRTERKRSSPIDPIQGRIKMEPKECDVTVNLTNHKPKSSSGYTGHPIILLPHNHELSGDAGFKDLPDMDISERHNTPRLMVAVDEILEVVGGTVSEFEEETARTKRENELLKRRLREVGLDTDTECSAVSTRPVSLSVSGQHQWSSDQSPDPESTQTQNHMVMRQDEMPATHSQLPTDCTEWKNLCSSPRTLSSQQTDTSATTPVVAPLTSASVKRDLDEEDDQHLLPSANPFSSTSCPVDRVVLHYNSEGIKTEPSDTSPTDLGSVSAQMGYGELNPSSDPGPATVETRYTVSDLSADLESVVAESRRYGASTASGIPTDLVSASAAMIPDGFFRQIGSDGCVTTGPELDFGDATTTGTHQWSSDQSPDPESTQTQNHMVMSQDEMPATHSQLPTDCTEWKSLCSSPRTLSLQQTDTSATTPVVAPLTSASVKRDLDEEDDQHLLPSANPLSSTSCPVDRVVLHYNSEGIKTEPSEASPTDLGSVSAQMGYGELNPSSDPGPATVETRYTVSDLSADLESVVAESRRYGASTASGVPTDLVSASAAMIPDGFFRQIGSDGCVTTGTELDFGDATTTGTGSEKPLTSMAAR
ncbi:unnamed protein product [Coregonus sp. 'balchen']|nr:unnamed protein product [Coregonus sp. 'balchen']